MVTSSCYSGPDDVVVKTDVVAEVDTEESGLVICLIDEAGCDTSVCTRYTTWNVRPCWTRLFAEMLAETEPTSEPDRCPVRLGGP